MAYNNESTGKAQGDKELTSPFKVKIAGIDFEVKKAETMSSGVPREKFIIAPVNEAEQSAEVVDFLERNPTALATLLEKITDKISEIILPGDWIDNIDGAVTVTKWNMSDRVPPEGRDLKAPEISLKLIKEALGDLSKKFPDLDAAQGEIDEIQKSHQERLARENTYAEEKAKKAIAPTMGHIKDCVRDILEKAFETLNPSEDQKKQIFADARNVLNYKRDFLVQEELNRGPRPTR